MKIEELYKVALKAMKEANSENEKFPCDNCPSRKIQIELNKEHVDYNHNGSTCSNALLYLQNLGIIKILSGIPGADCGNIKIKAICNFKYNKI